ncbi:MAG TPA: high-potential iron-sulfur protein [Steroidobacteraceae bacterium]
MTLVVDELRRRLLKSLVLGTVLIPLAGETLKAAAADLPLVSSDDPTAKALKYATDASMAPGAKPGSKCANCSLYQGGAAAQGGCLIFPGKAVKATGWCITWTAKPS